MTDDQQQIKKLIADWISATKAGDLPKLLSLMSEDIVFLQVDQPPMRGKDAFAANFRSAVDLFRIDAQAEVQEVEVMGDLAYCWNHLTVTATPIDGGLPARKTGYTFSVLRKLPQGNWVLARDANLLSTAAPRFA